MGRIGDDAAFPNSGVWNVRDVYRFWRGMVIAPAVVQSAALWLDAADFRTITESGGDVSQWDNKGTLGNFTQGTGALQPKTGVGTLNRRNVLNFAGDFMTSADAASAYKFLHDGTTNLVCAVWKPGTTVNDATSYMFLSTIDGSLGSFDTGASIFYTGSTTLNATQDLVVRGVGGTSAVGNTSSAGFSPSNSFLVFTSLRDPDNGTAANRSEIFANGGTAVKNNTQTNAVSTSNPGEPLQIGASKGVLPLTGSIAEIVIVSGADATEGNRVIIRDYLNAKWGVF